MMSPGIHTLSFPLYPTGDTGGPYPVKTGIARDPWVAQRFGACLWPRAPSWRPGIESHVGLPAGSPMWDLILRLQDHTLS